MKAAGIPVPDTEERWQQAMKALKVFPHIRMSSVLPHGAAVHCSTLAYMPEQLKWSSLDSLVVCRRYRRLMCSQVLNLSHPDLSSCTS